MLIAHDLGTTGNKASLHDEAGRLFGSVTVSYPVHFDNGGVAEQDPHAWTDAVFDATSALLHHTGTAPSTVRGMVVSGQMMGAVLLDQGHQPVRPAIIWADTRATAQTEQLIELLGEQVAYELLGHRLSPNTSVEQVMGAVLLDQGHPPVRPAVDWADTRGTAQTEQLFELLGEQVAYALLGHRLNPT